MVTPTELSQVRALGLDHDHRHVEGGDDEIPGVIWDADFDANTILKADTDDTPEALTVAEQRIVGRITSGNITGLTQAQVEALLLTDSARYERKQLELDFSQVSAHGKPTLVHRGVNRAFSLPIYNNDNEELFFNVHAPVDWDGASDLIILVDCYLDTANSAKNFQLRLEWENITMGTDLIPGTDNDVDVETATGTAAQYQSFRISFTVDYDKDTPALVEPGDCMCLRLTRINATADEIAGEVAVCKAILKYKVNSFGSIS